MSNENDKIDKYRVDFQSFTGISMKEPDKETLSLFFQFVQARNSIDIKQSEFKQANAIQNFVDHYKKES